MVVQCSRDPSNIRIRRRRQVEAAEHNALREDPGNSAAIARRDEIRTAAAANP